MEIKTLNDGFYANTYLLINQGEALIIDPAIPLRDIKTALKENKVVGVLLTHGHFDHFKTLKVVLDQYQVPCYLNKKAYLKLLDPSLSCAAYFGYLKVDDYSNQLFSYLSDGATIKIGSFQVKVIFTPGHTDCSVCYLINNCLFSGDTLFHHSVGRTDLPTGSAFVLQESLKKLLTLSEDYPVYPGHEEATSIQEEALNNPYYR